jgi:hypothetical protein
MKIPADVAGVLAGLTSLVLILLLRWIAGSAKPSSDRYRRQTLTSADAEKDAPSADQVFFDATKRLLDTQISGSDALDLRITSALQVGGTVFPVTFGLLSLLSNPQTVPSTGTRWLLVWALAAYVAVIGAAAVSFFIRKLEFRPNVGTIEHYRNEELDGAVLRLWVAEEYVNSFRQNQGRLQLKGWCALIALLALAAEILLLAIAALITVS